MRTNDLKELIQAQLKTVTPNVFYEVGQTKKMYPHIIFEFSSIDLGDFNRQDYILDVDVWDKSEDTTAVEDLCDSIEELFNNANLPQETILPTFFRIDRKRIPDEDIQIRHRLIRFQIQNYNREGETR